MDLIFDKNFILTKKAAEMSGYTPDYLARLARSGKISARRIGRAWLIDSESLALFLKSQGNRKIDYARVLAHAHVEEYASNLPHQDIRRDAPLRDTRQDAILLPTRGLRSHVLAIATAFFVVISGAFVAQLAVTPQFSEKTASDIFIFQQSNLPSLVSSTGTFISLLARTTEVFADTYQSIGEKGYRAIIIALDTYRSLIEQTGVGMLALADSAPDVFDRAPHFVYKMNLTLGNSIIGVTHALIRADVALAYAVAAAAPESARVAFALVSGIGSTLAGLTDRVPMLASALFLRATAATLDSSMAQGVFSTGYAGGILFVTETYAVLDAYLNVLNATGRLAYDGTVGTIAFVHSMSLVMSRIPAQVASVFAHSVQ